jgi:hypothetical protein
MKTIRSNRRQQGFATLLVMVIAGLMGTYLMYNTGTVHHVHKNLRLIEQKQLRKFSQPPKPEAPKTKPR